MNNPPLLYPQLDASFYSVAGGVHFKHDDQLVVASDFDVAYDPNTGLYTAEVNSTSDRPIRFDSAHHSHWPRAIRDLYWEHQKRKIR